jgi:hypothetical protein
VELELGFRYLASEVSRAGAMTIIARNWHPEPLNPIDKHIPRFNGSFQ